jgi:hypothetical protein
MNYEQVGKFIYGAYQNGAAPMDLENWMADDLGVARLKAGDDLAAANLMTSFFANYRDKDQLQDSYDRFVSTLKSQQS